MESEGYTRRSRPTPPDSAHDIVKKIIISQGTLCKNGSEKA